MEWRLRRVVPTAAVTTHAKPHAQQQLTRDLEVERSVVGQRCRLKVSARCSEAIRNHVDGWVSCELQPCCCTVTKKRVHTYCECYNKGGYIRTWYVYKIFFSFPFDEI